MKCAFCGTEFETENKLKKYCSVKCRRAAERVRKPKQETVRTCLVCGKTFTDTATKYCSAKCASEAKLRQETERRKHRRAERPVYWKTCPYCGKEFLTHESYRVYCSDECHTKKHREQHLKLLRQRPPAQKRAQDLTDKQVKRPTKSLDDWAREAAACDLDYGNYRALVAQGKSFEQILGERAAHDFKSLQFHTQGG